MKEENKKHLAVLVKYPEFYALKQELLDFCHELDDLNEIDLEKRNRLTVAEEVRANQYASKKIRHLLAKLGVLTKKDFKNQIQTYE
jgi:hypothetical protein